MYYTNVALVSLCGVGWSRIEDQGLTACQIKRGSILHIVGDKGGKGVHVLVLSRSHCVSWDGVQSRTSGCQSVFS